MEYLEQINGVWVVKKNYVDDLRTLGKEIKEKQATERTIKNGFRKEVEGISQTDFGEITISKSYPTITLDFDLERFKEENPDLYQQYVIPTYKEGSVRINIAKEKSNEGK